MSDPNGISLHSEDTDNSRRSVYILAHLANVIRKNVLLVAPDVDAKGFMTFLNGPSASTKKALLVSTGMLPKTITKSVVADLGKFRVESNDNIGYSDQFVKIFKINCYGDMAADFFIKNLTTARCNNGIVFIIQPYLVFRYGMKHRNHWIDRCRFIWIGCALFRIPSLLPVIAAQVFLYTIKIFIQEPSLTRKEQMSILAEILHFLPGMVSVARPPLGMGLSVWYREMARHRRIVLEAILDEARDKGDLMLYNPPYSMLNFDSIDALVAFVEEELRECDKQEAREKTAKMNGTTKKDPFGDESEVDEEDRELLQLGGCGGILENEEIEDEEEEEEENGGDRSETVTHYQSIPSDTTDNNMRERAKKLIEMLSEVEISLLVRRDSITVDVPSDGHIARKAPEDYGEIVENRKKRWMENGEENENDGEMSPPKKSTGANGIMNGEYIAQELLEERDDVMEECDNETAFSMIFQDLPDEWDEVEVSDWDPSYELSILDVQEGFAAAQRLLFGDSPYIESPMNLSIPWTTGEKNIYDESISCYSPPSPSVKMGVYGGISPPLRSDDDSREADTQYDDWNPEDEGDVVEVDRPPLPHVTFAPWKEMRVDVKSGNVGEGEEVDWVETRIRDDEEISFVAEIVGRNGGRGPTKIKREPVTAVEGAMRIETESASNN